METKPTIGQTLARARAKRGLSQAELARRCGFGKSHLSRIESGKAMPSLERLEQLFEELDIGVRTRSRLRTELHEKTAVSTLEFLEVLVARVEALAERVESVSARSEELRARLEERVKLDELGRSGAVERRAVRASR